MEQIQEKIKKMKIVFVEAPGGVCVQLYSATLKQRLHEHMEER